MCIAVFLWQSHPIYSFYLLLNRDEYYSRLTKPMAWWTDGEILGGRDELAGGTWLACNRRGKIAFVTNVREFPIIAGSNSRGELPLRFLESDKSPREFAEELAKEARLYAAFNLVLVDIWLKSMVYITNRPNPEKCVITEVSPGMHVLTNASLDTPWPKAQRLGHGFRDIVEKYQEAELPTREMVETLMKNNIRDEKTMLPNIHPSADWELQLSSIFVEADSSLGRYGTRSTSLLYVKLSGEVNFCERYMEEDQSKEHSVTFQAEMG